MAFFCSLLRHAAAGRGIIPFAAFSWVICWSDGDGWLDLFLLLILWLCHRDTPLVDCGCLGLCILLLTVCPPGRRSAKRRGRRSLYKSFTILLPDSLTILVLELYSDERERVLCVPIDERDAPASGMHSRERHRRSIKPVGWSLVGGSITQHKV